ncbi:agamous-like MADS-box protein AGL80 [Solanum verrucosum]|uniref:agamous-like MADS-box protein AGL80 n=1 Tax=Solanum verrucosum TaxID=315347 RepID=UPI0020D0DD10|nr:agamous-like MADS-box protein AGL80 [Solanum verrucosum]
MGRSKMKVELIQDHKKRMTTLVTRKAGLVKKISELSILCDIKACMIIHEGNNHQIWPSDSNDVQELINLYNHQPLDGRTKRGKTLSNFFENDEKKKAEIKVEKYPTWDSRFDYLSEKELQNLAGVVEKKMEKAKGKIELLKSMNVHIRSCSVSHQQIWDNNLMNQTTLSLWPISNVNSFTDYNNFFQSNIPISGMIEAENWSANVGIGSSSTMQPMGSNGIGSTSTMQPMGNNYGIGSTSTMQPTDQYPFIYNDSTRDIGSSSTMQPMDQYNDSTHDMSYGFV